MHLCRRAIHPDSRLFSLSIFAAIACLAAPPATSAPLRFGVSLISGTGDFAGNLYDPSVLQLRPYTEPEIGGRLSLQLPFAQHWVAEAGGGLGTYSLRLERAAGTCPDINACDDLEVEHLRTSNWSARVSVLRSTATDAPLSLFAGPGLELWHAHATRELTDGSQTDGPATTRWSALLRLGAEMPVHRGLRLRCAIGQRWGHAHAAFGQNQASWWAGSFDAELGVMFGAGVR